MTLPQQPRARRAAERRRALHGLSLRLGYEGSRSAARRRRRVLRSSCRACWSARVVKALGERQHDPRRARGRAPLASRFRRWRRTARSTPSGVVFMSLWGLMGPALQGVMTRLVSPSEQGQLQGANSSVLGIATLIGPMLFTQTFATFIGCASRLASAGRTVPALGDAARQLAGCRAARDGNASARSVPAAESLNCRSLITYSCARRVRCTSRVQTTAPAAANPQYFRGSTRWHSTCIEVSESDRFQLADDGG